MGQIINDTNNSTVVGNNINGINNSVKDVSVDKADMGNSAGRKSFYSVFNRTDSKCDFLFITTFVLSLFSSITALFLLCTRFPRCENLQFDYIGVILGMLSFLVTLLIGWQIFNALSIEGKLKKETASIERWLKKEITNMNKEISNKTIREIDIKIKDYDHHLGSVFMHTKANQIEDKKLSIRYYFRALYHANESTYKDNIHMIIEDMILSMAVFNPQKETFTSEELEQFKNILNKCDTSKVIGIEQILVNWQNH